MITSPLDDYSFGEFVYGQLTVLTHHSANEFKIHIPRLMTFGRSAPTKTKRAFNKNIFMNDAACKVTSSGSVTTQNYVTVERHRDTNLMYDEDINGNLRTGHKFAIQIMNRNLDDLWILKSVRNRS